MAQPPSPVRQYTHRPTHSDRLTPLASLDGKRGVSNYGPDGEDTRNDSQGQGGDGDNARHNRAYSITILLTPPAPSEAAFLWREAPPSEQTCACGEKTLRTT